MSAQVSVAKATDQATARVVLIKLLLFAAALAVLPIASFFLSSKYIWAGDAIYAAITAICIANVVLVAYIVLSILEDRQSSEVASERREAELKKDR
ncbi:hypothetical protein PISMIDRAFT_670624 [Pisolithus microcarpus 441]|uniref:Vacuolar ATPase assembly integral membrane protein VMA21 n=1 Tax=Pisolithus microcarpus 441 TaxID=765257 RepID=A0A0D0A813_9AGAM|nr:hypothetical protein PISMIDRAFT_670624 [Pisolithus microcarpus 441]